VLEQMNVGVKEMNKFDLMKKMKGMNKFNLVFYLISMHKLYDLRNKLIIKMFNFDLIRGSIAISKDIMTHFIDKCAVTM